MRLFIALSPTGEARAALTRNLAILRTACRRGNFSRAENLHVTLAFLGEISEDRLPDVRAAMDECTGTGTFSVTTGPLGRIRGRDGDTLVVRINASKALSGLQRMLSLSLTERGFSLEDRPYRPHLTLSRRAQLGEGETMESISARLESVTFPAERMTLFLSHRPNGVLTYTPLYSIEL